MRTGYKLTDQNMCTYDGFKWTMLEWEWANGAGGLCGPGWLHGYDDPILAAFLNPIHAAIANPRTFRTELDGERLDDRGLKHGHTRMRLVEEIPTVVPTVEQYVKFGILVCFELRAVTGLPLPLLWETWAVNWLSEADRSWAAARAAAEAAKTAWAAWAAAEAAKTAAAWAARAAEAAKAQAAAIDLIACAHEAML